MTTPAKAELETVNLTKEPDFLPQNNFLVRWSLNIAECEKIEKAGTQIVVTAVVPTMTVTTPSGEKTDISYVVKTDKGGMVPIAYLQPRPIYELRTDLEKEVAKGFAYQDTRIGTGRWWTGRIPPPEAAGRFASLSFSAGEFAVCQPPEWEMDKEWSPFCLIVRTLSGDIDQIWHEWRESEYYNIRFGKPLGHMRMQFYDEQLPLQPPSPSHGYVYFVVQRTITGDFFLESGSEFTSLEKLLDHYYTHALPLAGKRNSKLILRAPANVNKTPWSSPRPMLFPLKFPGYKKEPFKLVLAQKPGTPISKIFTLKWKLPLEKRNFVGDEMLAEEAKSKRDKRKAKEDDKAKEANEENDVSHRAYMHLNGSYHDVVIREMRKTCSKASFEKDMTRIHHADGSKYAHAHKEIIKADLKSPKFRPGYNYIAHIVCYADKKDENWMAYQTVPGTPLDRLMLKRAYDDWWMSCRIKLEVLYQVAAGMRFLEENFLCHRHLRAGNVCVYAEHLGSLSIKITDYMVPYSMLDMEFVETMDITEMEWPWMAPECLRHRVFDIISDVWSFGCLLFEMVHWGCVPYAFEDKKIVCAQDLAQFFMNAKKMTTVRNKDELETYVDDIMAMCLRYEGNERPTFDHLYRFLRQLLFDATRLPEKTIEEFVGNAPKFFQHKWSRPKVLKDHLKEKTG